LHGLAVFERYAAGLGIDLHHLAVVVDIGAARLQPAGQPGGDLAAMQRATFRREEGIAEGAGFKERPALYRSGRFDRLEGESAAGGPVAKVNGLVARRARNADEAARIEMVVAEIGP